MNTTAIERTVAGIKTRRALLGGIAALGLAVAAIETGDASRPRAKQRRRRRRGRQNGGGNGLGDGCQVCQAPGQCPFSTIQDAIDNSRGEGDEITVCPGTYKERISINAAVHGQNIVIQGTSSSQTIIDADGDGTAVTVLPATVAALEHVTITGGKAALGGGIVNRGGLTLKNCVITKNDNGAADNGGGGGIYNARGTHLFVIDSSIAENTALDGQGGGILNDGGTVALQLDSQVTENMADQGGGIFNRNGGTVTVESGSSVSGNEPDNCVGTTACGA